MIRSDWAIEALVDCAISISLDEKDPPLQKKRSRRAVQLLVEDSNAAYELHSTMSNYHSLNDDHYTDFILNPTTAGLMAKKLFASYRQVAKISPKERASYDSSGITIPLPDISLLNQLLMAILRAFPSSIVGAASAGGKEGLEFSLHNMLSVHSMYPDEESPLPIITKMVVVGCTGRPYEPYRETVTAGHQPNTMADSEILWVNKGHRRKFVRALIESGFLRHEIEGITRESDIDDALALSMDSLCDSLIAIIDSVAHPTIPTNADGKKERIDESVGEEALLSFVCNEEVIRSIIISAGISTNPSSAARFLLALYESATGISKKNVRDSAGLDSTEDDGAVNAKAVKESLNTDEMNKFLKNGLTAKLHAAIISHMDLFVQALDMNSQASELIDGQNDGYGHIISSVKHPGGYIVQRPFTSRRLNLITLLADLLFVEASSNITPKDSLKTAFPAMDSLMTFPLSLEEVDGKKNVTMNPWPGLCILLFDYPENNMFQIQFYRLLLALCLSNHEPTLKLVVQKSKFISRSLSIFQNSKRNSSVRGVLIKCLNVLRLSSQSLSSQSFLRHFLDSHDQWKMFQSELMRLTMEQVIPGGGFSVPSTNGGTSDYFNLDLGSPFAVELGFPLSKQKFSEDELEAPPDASPTKGDKKKRKKKKKKPIDTNIDDDQEE